jgi:hypothetical protein
MAIAERSGLLIGQFFLVFFFFFFICGLLAAATLCARILSLEGEAPEAEILPSNAGLHLLGGVIAFCLFCNLILVVPSVLELVAGLNTATINSLHQLCIIGIKGVTIIIACLGVASVLGQSQWRKARQLGHGVVNIIPAIDKISLLLIVMVMSVYVVVAQFFAGINYDTALYHLPAVQHFLHYGLEVGLANFHFSLGFYNLVLFGQVAIQSLSPSRLILSPSLNIVFFIAFVLAVIQHLLAGATNNQSSLIAVSWHGDRDGLRVMAFFLLALILGAQSVDSFVSYNADFAVSMTTLALVFILYFSKQPQLRHHALALSLFLPLLKLSGMLGLILIVLMEALAKLTFIISAKTSPILLADLRAAWRSGLTRSVTALAITSYVMMLLTNYILSGYLIFPESRTGPLAEHAVPLSIVHHIKGALVTYYARSNDTGKIAKLAFEQQWSLSQWLPELLRTQRGQLMALWVMAATAMALIIAILWMANRSRKPPVKLLCLSLAMPVIASLALFVLPPNPRFFPWAGSLIGFEFAELVVFYPSIALLSVTMLMALITWRLQRPMLKAVGEVPTREVRSRSSAIRGWKPRSQQRDGKGHDVLIRTPFNDKCWATESPCTPYLWFLEGREPVRPLPDKYPQEK